MSQFLIQTVVDTRERPAHLLATSTFLDHALTASVDRTVRYLNPLTYEEESGAQGHTRGVTALAISECIQSQAPIICSSARDGVLCLWGPRKAEVIRKMTPACPEIKTLSVFQYATVCYVILGTKDGQVIVYDTATDSILKTLLGHRSAVLCSSAVYRGKHLNGEPLVSRHIAIATGGKDKTVRVWDFDKGKRKRKLKHPKMVTCLAVARESIKPVLISGCTNGLLYLWDVAMGLVLRSFEGHQEKIYSVCLWETHEILVASCAGDNTIRVFDALSGECVTTMVGHKRPVKQIALFTDYESGYSVLISVSMDRTWRIWDITSVLGTYFYPPLPEDFVWPEEGSVEESELKIGRNEVPADNPDFEYTSKDGVKKRGSTKTFVRDRDDEEEDEEADSDGENKDVDGHSKHRGGVGKNSGEEELFNDDDFELSEDDIDVDADADAETEVDGDSAQRGWGGRHQRPAAAKAIEECTCATVSSNVDIVTKSDLAADLAAYMSASSVGSSTCTQSVNAHSVVVSATTVNSDSSTSFVDSAGTGGLNFAVSVDAPLSAPISGAVTPLPDGSSSTYRSRTGTGGDMMLSPKEMLKHSEHLQDKFVTALATVELQHARERSRQASNLSQRLSSKRNSTMKSISAPADAASDYENGGNVTPTPPSAAISTATLSSPLAKRRVNGAGVEGGNSGELTGTVGDSENDQALKKDQMKKEHEIHTTRHKSRMSIAQTRAANRLAQRLSMQAKKKFKQLSETEREELKTEMTTEGNSDDDYDGKSGKIEEDEDEDDD